MRFTNILSKVGDKVTCKWVMKHSGLITGGVYTIKDVPYLSVYKEYRYEFHETGTKRWNPDQFVSLTELRKWKIEKLDLL